MLKQVLGGLVLLVASAGGAPAQTVTAVPQLDLDRLAGTWFELALLPNKAEKACLSDALVLYAGADKPHRLQVVNACTMQGGNVNARNADLKPNKKSTDGKLKIIYTWPFSQKYWFLALGANYEWALIGSPNHKTLWILSRTRTLAPDVLADIKTRAAAQGFDPARLVDVPHRR